MRANVSKLTISVIAMALMCTGCAHQGEYSTTSSYRTTSSYSRVGETSHGDRLEPTPPPYARHIKSTPNSRYEFLIYSKAQESIEPEEITRRGWRITNIYELVIVPDPLNPSKYEPTGKRVAEVKVLKLGYPRIIRVEFPAGLDANALNSTVEKFFLEQE